jgi:hypothetical protein
MQRIVRTLLVLLLSLGLSGCLGTVVTAPVSGARTHGFIDAHLILAPTAIDARDCAKGLKEVAVDVPLWSVAVGIVTFGIVAPMNTTFTCERARWFAVVRDRVTLGGRYDREPW